MISQMVLSENLTEIKSIFFGKPLPVIVMTAPPSGLTELGLTEVASRDTSISGTF